MTEKTWGMRFNERPDYQRFSKEQIPQGCPEWFNPFQIKKWHEQGLILWTNIEKRTEFLSGDDALKLLSRLISQDNWKTDGVSITHLVHKMEVQLPPRGRRDIKGEAPKIESTKAELVDEERMRLPPEAGPELIDLLQTNERVITEMANQEKKRYKEVLGKALEMLLEFTHRKAQDDFDFAVRPFGWQRDETSRWSCQHQEAKGRIYLGESKVFWHACVRRPGYTGKSNYFMKFIDGVEWVEKELVDLANQPEVPVVQPRIRTEEQMDADRVRLQQKLRAGSYWIDAALMQPKRLTYKIFMELDAKPVDFKIFELACGDTFRYDERYLSPSKLATTLNLDIDQFDIVQPIGKNSEWYQVTSLTTYYQESSAAQQAQQAWNQNQILPQFKAGKISRARYGYEEVETGFAVFLGACEDPDKPWREPITRSDHLEWLALQESLSFALDVTDYRDYLGVSAELISDERILHIMHGKRARSKYLPDEIKRESKIWLAQHEPMA